MKKNWKKFLLAILGVAIIGLSIASCSNDTSASSDDSSGSSGSSSGSSGGSSGKNQNYNSQSDEGRLILEPVANGIKVTVKLLDSDIKALLGREKNFITYNNFYIRETSTQLAMNLKKPYIEASGTEVSEVFPFVEKGKKYTFDFDFSIQLRDDGTEPVTHHKEHASCTATADGLNADDYFDFDYKAGNISLYADNAAILHMDKDITRFFKTNDASDIYLKGNVVAGKTDWSNSEWASTWMSNTDGSNATEGWNVKYDRLTSNDGYSIYYDILEDYSGVESYEKIMKYKNWGIDGVLYFTLDGKSYCMSGFKYKDASTDYINWKKWMDKYVTKDSSKFKSLPTSTGNSPAGQKTDFTIYKGTRDEATMTLGEYESSHTISLQQGTNAPYQELTYSWDDAKKKVYCKYEKISGKTYEDSLTGSFINDLNKFYVFSSMLVMDYTVDGDKLKLVNSEIKTDNIKDLLLCKYANRFSSIDSDGKKYCGNRYIEIIDNKDKTDKIYVIADIDDEKMLVMEYKDSWTFLGPLLEVPYSFTDSQSGKKLTFELFGKKHTLDYEVLNSLDLELDLN